MTLDDKLSAGLSMILTKKYFCPDYRNWYNNIMQTLGSISDRIITQNFTLARKDFRSNGPIYFDINPYIPSERKLTPYQLKHVKVLHTKDNTKSVDIGRAKDDKWLITGLTEDYFHSIYILILFVKN